MSDDELAPPFTFLNAHRPESTFGAELQHLFRSQYFHLTSGIGYVNIDGQIDTVLGSISPPPFDVLQSRTSRDLEHANVYAYSYIDLPRNMTLTLGASGDFTSGESPDVGDKREFNPKFGIIWSPLVNTTLRAAAFRVFKRTLITDQTLEPTQIVGFNQFFDDDNGTEAWRYGAAIDQKFTKSIFGGVELSKRDLKVKTTEPAERDWKEYLGRTYLFWAPHSWLALRAEYLFERFEFEGSSGQTELDTHRVPLGIRFFHPYGWSAALTATYWNQDVEFEDSRTGRDDFWTVDAGISYRLPKRYGFITIGATNLFDKKFNFFNTDHHYCPAKK